jgi:peptidoglycan/LPS O-acetylase OafA/YrhL
MNNKIKTGGYMPQLDSLRAFAVLLVIISHWFSHDHLFNRYFANGILGVTLFFVLSGYLITGILLRSKTSIENGGSMKAAFKSFYVRRSLRIFPIYYLLLFVLLIINVADIQKSFSWHFFYLSNFYFWVKGAFGGNLSHFWSLAVEEQFYLFWPALIFFVPRSKLVTTFIALIVFSTIFRLVILNPPAHMGRFLMPASLDSFCIGALLAYGQQQSNNWYKWIAANFSILLLALSAIFIGYTFCQARIPFAAKDYVFLSSYFLLISLIFGLIILRCSVGVNNKVVKVVMNNKALIYLGKISYGLYLYHNLIPYFYNIHLAGFLSTYSYYIVQVIRLLALIGLSTLSWYVIEKPLLKLKDRFAYKPKEVHKEAFSNIIVKPVTQSIPVVD